MAENAKQTRRRGEMARALDAAFSGCDQWTVVAPRRRGAVSGEVAGNPIVVAEAARAAIDAAARETARAA